MSTVVANEALRAFLAPLREPTEIKDAGGNVIGFFTPASGSCAEGGTDHAKARKLFEPEEIKRRKERSRNDPGRTLDQIIQRLDGLVGLEYYDDEDRGCMTSQAFWEMTRERRKRPTVRLEDVKNELFQDN